MIPIVALILVLIMVLILAPVTCVFVMRVF